MAYIETWGLGLTRGGKAVLQDVELSIEQGELFALIGPTGAGKTSLLRHLDLLEMPTSGAIAIAGQMVGPSVKERLALRRRMAFVQQKPVAFNISVFDNAALGLRFRSYAAAQVARRVDEVLELVGLEGKEKQNARTLSGGEMQRVAVARALVTRPDVLFLDEPTANLDPVSNAKIEEVLARVTGESKITVVMATHDMSQGQRLAGRIGVLMDGRLRQVGSSHDIFTSPGGPEVAEFVGVGNVWPGVVAAQASGVLNIRINDHTLDTVGEFAVGEAVDVLLRPEEVTLSVSRSPTSARNTFAGRVVDLKQLWPLTRVTLDCGFPVLALVTWRSADEMGLEKGQTVYASFKATSARVVKRWMKSGCDTATGR